MQSSLLVIRKVKGINAVMQAGTLSLLKPAANKQIVVNRS